VHPEEGHKTGPRGGTPLLWGQAERAGAVQPGEKVPRPPQSSLSISKGAVRRKGTDSLIGDVVTDQGEVGSN